MTATQRLIAAVRALNPTGEIGDGMVAQLHDLANRAAQETACRDLWHGEPIAWAKSPRCPSCGISTPEPKDPLCPAT